MLIIDVEVKEKMEPNQLAIPFDVRVLQENILKKIIQKIWKLTKKVIRRSVDIIFSLLVIIFFAE